jgi:hypothetical protein
MGLNGGPGVIMNKLTKVEQTLAWAAQQGYYLAEDAAAEYGAAAGREMYWNQPYYNAYAWRDYAWRDAGQVAPEA